MRTEKIKSVPKYMGFPIGDIFPVGKKGVKDL
jgi:hypothetical protein